MKNLYICKHENGHGYCLLNDEYCPQSPCKDEEIITYVPVKQEWISVKDRLPEAGHKPYLTCRKTIKGRIVIESRYLHTSYESPCVAYWEGKKNGEVTHWMPLPEPPKESE